MTGTPAALRVRSLGIAELLNGRPLGGPPAATDNELHNVPRGDVPVVAACGLGEKLVPPWLRAVPVPRPGAPLELCRHRHHHRKARHLSNPDESTISSTPPTRWYPVAPHCQDAHRPDGRPWQMELAGCHGQTKFARAGGRTGKPAACPWHPSVPSPYEFLRRTNRWRVAERIIGFRHDSECLDDGVWARNRGGGPTSMSGWA